MLLSSRLCSSLLASRSCISGNALHLLPISASHPSGNLPTHRPDLLRTSRFFSRSSLLSTHQPNPPATSEQQQPASPQQPAGVDSPASFSANPPPETTNTATVSKSFFDDPGADPTPQYERYSAGWWKEKAIIFSIFSVTGPSSMYFVRPLLGYMDITGSMIDGPMSYRLASLFIVTPAYSALLVLISHLFQRGPWGIWFVRRMWSRLFSLPSRLLKKSKSTEK